MTAHVTQLSQQAKAATLVVEIVTEELPPKALKRLGAAFADGITAGLGERGFTTPASVVTPFASYATDAGMSFCLTARSAERSTTPVIATARRRGVA